MARNRAGGARAPKNFDPRYGDRKRASRSGAAPARGDASEGRRGASDGRRGAAPTARRAGASAEDRAQRSFRTDRDRTSDRGAGHSGWDDRGGSHSRHGAARQQAPRRGAGQQTHGRGTSRGRERAAERPDLVHERLHAQQIDADAVADATFTSLGLGQNIVAAVAELGAERPFPIQAATIPVILAGRDTLGRGRTGSGKTIAFGAPLVESVLRSKAGTRRAYGRAPAALVLAPTRELALQIDATIQPIARSVGLFTTQVYGGVPQGRQVGALRKGVDIVIGTPGRIEDLHRQGKLDLSQIRMVVLDEADHMCELGFLEPVQRILRLLPKDSQKLLFSATLDTEVEALVREFLVDPAVFEVAGEDQASGTIEHRVLVVDHRNKLGVLTELVRRDGKTLVFTRTRAYAEQLADAFDDAGIAAVALHGDLTQAVRTRNLGKLTSGRASVLVATDVAARGIHVDDVDLVIQADSPDEYKSYLHRAGRTGRAGQSGRVVTLVTRNGRRRLGELLERADIDAPFQEASVGDDLIDEIAGRPTIAQLTGRRR